MKLIDLAYRSRARTVGQIEHDETNLVRLPSFRQGAINAVTHDACALIHPKSGDAGADRGHRNRAQSVLSCKTKRMIHRRTQRVIRRAPTELHARGMNDMTRGQVATAGDRGLANPDRSVSIAFALNRGTTASAARASDSSSEHQLIVRSVDACLD